MKTLVLNADYTPVDIISYRRGLVMMLSDPAPAYCIEYSSKSIRDSKGRQYKLPSVIVLKNYVHINHNKFTFSKVNVYYRDKFTCCYCNVRLERKELTIDHVIPTSRWRSLGFKGSANTFENTVTSCEPCNFKKRNRTPEEAQMCLLSTPRKISRRQVFINRILLLNDVPNSWMAYLGDTLHEHAQTV